MNKKKNPSWLFWKYKIFPTSIAGFICVFFSILYIFNQLIYVKKHLDHLCILIATSADNASIKKTKTKNRLLENDRPWNLKMILTMLWHWLWLISILLQTLAIFLWCEFCDPKGIYFSNFEILKDNIELMRRSEH